MSSVYAKCPNCNQVILIDDNRDANICPKCKEPFVTEKAIKSYSEYDGKENQVDTVKKRHIWKSLGKGLLMTLECIGYLCYVLCLVWLFVDITDGLKKK